MHLAQLALRIRAADGSTVQFTATRDTRTTLSKFVHARGITDD